MTTPQQTLERAYAALSAAAFAHPSAADEIGTQCSEAAKELRALLATQAQGQDAAPAEQPQAVELLDERGEIRRDLKGSAYCVGNEYKPFHPSASHVRPEWRDGWNACFVAAIRAARAKE